MTLNRDFIALHHGQAKADLATAFVERCRSFCSPGGAYAIVTPQNWLFLTSYTKIRQSLLREQKWHIVARLGSSAFETIGGAVVNVALIIASDATPDPNSMTAGIDASQVQGIEQKIQLLAHGQITYVSQKSQVRNPDSRISLQAKDTSELLSVYAESLQGISPADLPRYGRLFWEVSDLGQWEFWAGSPEQTSHYEGRSKILWWDNLQKAIKSGHAFVRGKEAWNQTGVAVGQMSVLPATLYTGDKFDTNMAVILPSNRDHLPAIWAFCSSPEFNTAVRRIDSAIKVTNATLVKVPFDFERWQSFAEELWPGGLPEPYSDDPTQWLFQGDPLESTDPLQVALARLLGYQWPQQDADHLTRLAIPDGILPLTPVAGQEPAVERLRRVLNMTYGDDWSTERQRQLLLQVGFAGKGLDDWLRDGFFEQHCKIFHHRPFIWHIWDGRKDGFSALVNYHELDSANLDKLIYTYLGDWIRTQQSAEDSDTPGANARLVAALELQKKLEAIRDGEDPYDIHVRWKPVHEQPIGWDPDLNDGVRLNIRPFVTAAVLRSKVKVNWNKDRGRDPDGSERINDLHFGLDDKRAAREAVKA